MGAWGHEAFDNDTAADWASRTAEEGSTESVRDALAAYQGDGADTYVIHEAVAAAQVVAWMAEGDSVERTREVGENPYVDDLLPWLVQQSRPDRLLIEEARRVMCLATSEAALEGWFDPTARLDAMQALRTRVDALPAGA
jgi:hypothetical protein